MSADVKEYRRLAEEARAENERLRHLLALARPFISHNGWQIQVGALGIKSDRQYHDMTTTEENA